ncbi:hypothetical protein IBX73_04765 [candidate division WOR-3 bacterium]|nr:hypothetical protein [candidate division WOR-3 bacterium]
MELNGAQAVESFPVEHALRAAEHAPGKRVVVFVNDADLLVHGADRFIETARTRPDMLVVYVNTMVYPVVHSPTVPAPPDRTAAYGSGEIPFNIPCLAASCGAYYIARWTSLHTRRLAFSIVEALSDKRFSVIEVIAPCLMYYAKYLPIKTSIDRPKHMARVVLDHGAPVNDLDLRRNSSIVVGIFRQHDHGNRSVHEDAPGR